MNWPPYGDPAWPRDKYGAPLRPTADGSPAWPNRQAYDAWHAWYAGRTPKRPSNWPAARVRALLTVVIFVAIVIGVIVATRSSGSSSNDVKLITPINPDCATSATLCKADADLIRNACDNGTTGIGLLLNSASDPTTKSLYESELSALCPEKQVH